MPTLVGGGGRYHKMLIEAFVNQGDADLAERVCRIPKKKVRKLWFIIMHLLILCYVYRIGVRCFELLTELNYRTEL